MNGSSPPAQSESAGRNDWARGADRRLEIDWTRCDGHGLCAALLPERVQLDEWGFPVMRSIAVTDVDEPDVRRAVAACPALALRLTRSTP
jgi:ferredoxin